MEVPVFSDRDAIALIAVKDLGRAPKFSEGVHGNIIGLTSGMEAGHVQRAASASSP